MGSTSDSDATMSGGADVTGAPTSDDEAAAMARGVGASDVPSSGEEAVGDAVSGMTNDSDGAPAPTGSIPPGPGTPDGADTTDATALPPLSERMY